MINHETGEDAVCRGAARYFRGHSGRDRLPRDPSGVTVGESAGNHPPVEGRRSDSLQTSRQGSSCGWRWRAAARRQGRCEAQRLERGWSRGPRLARGRSRLRGEEPGSEGSGRRDKGIPEASGHHTPRDPARCPSRPPDPGRVRRGSVVLPEGLRPQACIALGKPGSGFSLKGRRSRLGQKLA